MTFFAENSILLNDRRENVGFFFYCENTDVKINKKLHFV